MSRSEKRSWMGLGLLVSMFIALLVVGLSVTTGLTSKASAKTPVSATATCGNPQTAVANMLVSKGFQPGQFVIGDGNFNLNLPAAQSAAPGKFSQKPLDTKVELISFLKSGTPSSSALLTQVEGQASASQAQALDPNNWVGFQIFVPSNWNGNTSFVNGQVVSAGTRVDPAGDIGWVLVNSSGCHQSGSQAPVSYKIGIVRGGCGNHEVVLPTPPPPPIPTCPCRQSPPTTVVPPPCRQCGPPPTTPPTTTPTTLPPCNVQQCLSKTYQPPQDNSYVPPSATQPTQGAPSTPPPNTTPAPSNNTGTSTQAPAPTQSGSNSGSTSGTSGVPSGSTTSGGSTTTGSDSGTSNSSNPTGSNACDSSACGSSNNSMPPPPS